MSLKTRPFFLLILFCSICSGQTLTCTPNTAQVKFLQQTSGKQAYPFKLRFENDKVIIIINGKEVGKDYPIWYIDNQTTSDGNSYKRYRDASQLGVDFYPGNNVALLYENSQSIVSGGVCK